MTLIAFTSPQISMITSSLSSLALTVEVLLTTVARSQTAASGSLVMFPKTMKTTPNNSSHFSSCQSQSTTGSRD